MTIAGAGCGGHRGRIRERAARPAISHQRYDMFAELALVAACARWPRDGQQHDAVRAAAAAVRDWHRFEAAVLRHRLVGPADRALRGLAGVPDDVAARLAARARAQCRTNLGFAAEAVRLARSMRDAGLAPLFLKGPALAKLLFDDIGLRHCRDLDLLVEPEAVADAAALLEAEGYAATHPVSLAELRAMPRWLHAVNQLDYRHAQRGTLVELHWRIAPNAQLGSAWWTRAHRAEVQLGSAGGVATLAGADLFAYLCLHGALHAWSRLKWLADVAALLARVDAESWAGYHAHAASLGLARPAGQALLTAATFLQLDLPPQLHETLRSDLAVCRLHATAQCTIRFGGGAQEPERTRFGSTRIRLSHFLLAPGARHWIGQARAGLVNPADWTVVKLPPRLAWLQLALRPLLWLWRRR